MPVAAHPIAAQWLFTKNVGAGVWPSMPITRWTALPRQALGPGSGGRCQRSSSLPLQGLEPGNPGVRPRHACHSDCCSPDPATPMGNSQRQARPRHARALATAPWSTTVAAPRCWQQKKTRQGTWLQLAKKSTAQLAATPSPNMSATGGIGSLCRNPNTDLKECLTVWLRGQEDRW
eukprot:gene819-biopygen8240